MQLPYVLTILVTTGDPDGVRVVEKSNWSGRCVVFARSDLSSAASSISSPGVYVMLGEDPDDESDGLIYVGEGEDVGKRLASHQSDQTKDFWVETVAFVSKDDALNKAHIRYVESRLIELGHEARRSRLLNGTKPSVPPMSAADHAEAEGFLAEMLAIFPVLGVTAFDKPEARQIEETLYHLSGPDAEGNGEDRSEGFFVFEGASARIEEAPSITSGYQKLRAKLHASGVFVEDEGVYRMTQGYLFRSPSAAAAALLGRTANGRIEWKDSAGVTLRDRQAAQAPSGD